MNAASINLDAVPEAETADFTAETAAWLLRQIPWSTAEHVIRAVSPAPTVARQLGLGPSVPCLEVTRRTAFESPGHLRAVHLSRRCASAGCSLRPADRAETRSAARARRAEIFGQTERRCCRSRFRELMKVNGRCGPV